MFAFMIGRTRNLSDRQS